MKGVGCNYCVSELLGHIMRLRSNRWFGRLGGSWGGNRGFTPQNLVHYRSTGRTFAFDGFAPVLRRNFHCFRNLFLRLALNAVTFWHRKVLVAGASCARPIHVNTLESGLDASTRKRLKTPVLRIGK